MRRLLLVVLLLLLWAPAAEAWTWPALGPVLQGFSFDKADPYAPGQHRGIDIGSSGGGQVVAPASGTVTFAGSVPTSGLCITIATADGLAVTLTHLGSISVQPGVAVEEGASIGTVGPSGTPEVDGPYVHLGIRVAADPNGYLDPLSLLPPPGTPASPSQIPAPAPAPAPHPASAGSTAPAVADTTTKTTVSSAAPPPAPGPTATGATAPVEVPTSDYATHAVEAAAQAPAPVSRVEPTRSASGAAAHRVAVVTSRSDRRTSADRARSRGERSRRRGGQTHRARVAATPAPMLHVVAASHPAFGGDGRIDPIPTRRPARVARADGVSHPSTSSPGRWTPPATFAGVALIPLLFLLVLLFRRRRAEPAAPPSEEAIVLPLPVARRLGSGRDHDRLAA